MTFRFLILLGALPLLAACHHNGQESTLPASTDLTFAAGDPNAAKNAADQCAAYNLKAVPAGKGLQQDTVLFRCQ